MHWIGVSALLFSHQKIIYTFSKLRHCQCPGSLYLVLFSANLYLARLASHRNLLLHTTCNDWLWNKTKTETMTNPLLRSTLLFILFLALHGQISAQILIDYELPGAPDALEVCDSAVFQVTLTNNGQDLITGVSITLNLPEGVRYNPGTVSNASEEDISDLSNPVFSIPDLDPSEIQVFAFFARADCELVEAINNNVIFTNTISVNYDGGSQSIITDPYDIETALLVLTNITNQVTSGSLGDIITRTLTYQNTRFGKLSSFVFSDVYEPGIVISSPDGTTLPSGPGQLLVELDGADFSQIGDGDAFFELNESIVITEVIEVVDCGVDATVSNSDIEAYWGCESAICQTTESIDALVNIFLTDLSPNLEFIPSSEPPLCFCGDLPTTHSMMITNNGTEAASNITLTLRLLTEVETYAPGGFVVDSAEMVNPVTPILNSLPATDYLCESFNGNIYTGAVLSYPSLAVGDTIIFSWEVLHCKDGCSSVAYHGWEYDYGYYKSCPPNPFISNEELFVQAAGNPVYTSTIAEDDSVLEDGDIRTFEYEIVSDYLLEQEGNLQVMIELPCGFTWQNSPFIIDGQSPDIGIENTDTSVIITALFDLPFSNDSLTSSFDLLFNCDETCQEALCIDSIETSCETPCFEVIPPSAGFEIASSISPLGLCPPGCGITTCDQVRLSYDCENIEYCIDTIPGYLKYNSSFKRVNFGLPDNDDNREPDPGGSLDFDLVRTDRAVTGDTLQSIIEGAVITDFPDSSFDYAFVDVTFGALNLNMDINGGLLTQSGILFLEATVEVFDASANLTYTCTAFPSITPYPQPDDVLIYAYDLSASTLSDSGGCGFPSDFRYADGDSIRLVANYRVMYNLLQQIANNPFPPIVDLVASPNVFLFNDPVPAFKRDLFSCDCQSQAIEVTGYNYDVFNGIFALDPCDTSAYTGSSLFRFDLGEGDFFPYEYRSLAHLPTWYVVVPDEVMPVETKITTLQRQEQEILLIDQLLDPIFDGTEYSFDLTPYLDPPLDEGYSILVQYRFLNGCSISGSFPLSVRNELYFPSGFPNEPNPLDSLYTNPSALRTLQPNLQLDADFFNITAFGENISFDFIIENLQTSVASSVSDTASFCWFYPVSPSGDITNFELVNTETGDIYPQVSGIFQLGNLAPNDTFALQLRGVNSSCETESVIMQYGWSCDPYTNPVLTPCYKKTISFSVISPPAELELSVTSPVSPFPLCETVDYHTVEIFNAQLGTAYELLAQVDLPAGLSILPGSSQLEYPIGSGFVDIDDPELNGSIAEWQLAQYLTDNSLPGINSGGQNALNLRFLTTTSCDFISGSFPIFYTRALQNCELPTNSLARAGDPLEVTGVNAPYTMSIDLQLPDPACDDQAGFLVQLFGTGPTTTSDSIFITLPAGVDYVDGSYVGIENAPTTVPFVTSNGDQDILRWQLPANLPANDTIIFSMFLEGFAELDCGSELIRAQTVSPASAFCASAGTDCDLLVETGSTFLPVEIERPFFDLSNLSLVINPPTVNDGISYSVDILNNGAQALPPTILDFYIDQDGDGLLSVGDEFLLADTLDFPIGGSQSVLATGFFPFIDEFCNLLVVIDSTKHCACAVDQAVVSGPINFYIPTPLEVCSGETIMLGSPSVAGHIYQWTPDDNLSCSNCAQPEFSLENTTNSTLTHNYTLAEQRGDGCIINYFYTVIVYPEVNILQDDALICPGDSVTLSVTEGLSYFWTGPGISDPDEMSQTVSPPNTAQYAVMVTDQAGCSGMDSILVEVLTLPIVDAGSDTTFCPGEFAQLGAEANDDYAYFWSPPTQLNNPISPDPIILDAVSTTYELVVTDENGCTNTDAVTVNFGTALNLVVSPDQQICDAQTIQLSASGAATYSWSPTTGLDCTDCPLVNANPNESIVYTVTGFSPEGCADSSSITVTVSSFIETGEEMSICEGETIFIFDQEVGAAGDYCETYATLAGCDSTHCVTLSVLPALETDEPIELCEGDTLFLNNQIYTTAGRYCESFIGANGCDSTHCVDLSFVAPPSVELLDTSIVAGESVQIILPEENTYSWSPDTGISCTDCNDPVFSPEETTTYQVIITSARGCTSIQTVTIRVVTICFEKEPEIPSAFTPDGDGINDTFGVATTFGFDVVASIKIYNRWGEKVFEATGLNPSWDGRRDGELATADVYVYIITVECSTGESEVMVGDVTLIR